MNHTNDTTDSIFPATSPLMSLLMLLFFLFVGSMVGTAIIMGIGYVQGLNLQEAFLQMSEDSSPEIKNFIRLATLINHLFTFILPAILFAWFFYRRNWFRFLRLDRKTLWFNALLGIFFILATFPLAQWFFQLNKAIPLPEWANTIEDSASNLVSGLLTMNSVGELLFNLLIIALIPALGEELLFRGVIQQKMTDWTRKPQLAIWLTAVIFSGMHLQFQGFLPRLLLGAALGYLLVWTKNIWIPILAHFFNNGLQIVVAFFMTEEIEDMTVEEPESISFAVAVFSAIFVVATGYILYRYNTERIQTPANTEDE